MKAEDEVGAVSGLLAAVLPKRRAASRRFLLAGVAAIAAPKCFLCAAGYVAVLGGLSVGGPELCGSEAAPQLPWLEAGFISGLTAWVVFRFRRKAGG